MLGCGLLSADTNHMSTYTATETDPSLPDFDLIAGRLVEEDDAALALRDIFDDLMASAQARAPDVAPF